MQPARGKAKVKEQVKLAPIRKTHACDRCGVSRMDRERISVARFEIKTAAGSIYLCGHHFRKHRTHIHEHGYETVDHEASLCV